MIETPLQQERIFHKKKPPSAIWFSDSSKANPSEAVYNQSPRLWMQDMKVQNEAKDKAPKRNHTRSGAGNAGFPVLYHHRLYRWNLRIHRYLQCRFDQGGFWQ